MNTTPPLALVTSLLLLSATASVQAEDKSTLETMTVTANKTEENVQEVASSLSVFSGDQIEELRIESVSDIAAYSPNFTINESGRSGSNAPSMRGMFADLHTHSVSVALYVDGVPILEGMGYEQAMIDTERVEVLKGPQGTLYGKSSEAGIVNIITRVPDNEIRFPITAELGIDGKIKATGTISAPIIEDKFYASLSFLHDQKDGWVEDTAGNTVDDLQQDYLAAKLRFTPTDNLDILLGGNFLKYNNGQPHMNLSDKGAMMYGLPSPKDRVTSPSFNGYDDSDTMSQSLNVNYRLSDTLKLSSTTAYREVSHDTVADFDFNPQKLLHFRNDNELSRLSEELRIGSVGTPIKWVAGIYADTDKVEEDYAVLSIIPEMAITVNDVEMTGKSGSAFAHMNIPFGDFSVLGGLRYDYQKKEFDQPSHNLSLENNWDQISPKIGVEYRISEESMTYATISKGYLPGGFNAYARDPQYLSYDEEKLWSYEVGIKNTFWDNRLILNAAAFYMDITDAQVLESLDAATSYTTNAAEVSSIGFELEAVATLMQGLTVNAGIGYVDAEFDQFSDANGNYEGNKKPYAPDYTFNVGATYRTPMGLYFGANIVGSGDMYTDKNNLFKQDAYALVNAKIGYETDKFDIYIYAKNIFDEEYDTFYSDGIYTIYSKPAEFGAMLSYRF